MDSQGPTDAAGLDDESENAGAVSDLKSVTKGSRTPGGSLLMGRTSVSADEDPGTAENRADVSKYDDDPVTTPGISAEPSVSAADEIQSSSIPTTGITTGDLATGSGLSPEAGGKAISIDATSTAAADS
jgi:hypothetical protein